MTVVSAPAKLTLSLRITGVRADGYHLIDAEMVTLELADTLTIRELGDVDTGDDTGDDPGDRVTTSGPFSVGVPLRSNLVAMALGLAGRRAAVHIDKQIPHGGGLGGGSADAAAVLRWAGYTDLSGAAGLGADIAFCLVGGRARVRGIGEIVEPLDPVAMDITLVIPPLTCSTPAVYRAWDDLGGPSDPGGNDLTPAALVVEPRLADWRARIRDESGQEPLLAGSGATWFLHGHHPALEQALPDATVILTRTACPPENDSDRSPR